MESLTDVRLLRAPGKIKESNEIELITSTRWVQTLMPGGTAARHVQRLKILPPAYSIQILYGPSDGASARGLN
jgi:hypothetical protein